MYAFGSSGVILVSISGVASIRCMEATPLLLLPQALYLAAVVENDDQKIGLLLWLTLLGDAAISLPLSPHHCLG